MLHRYVHTVPDCLASGKPLFFGDEVELAEREVKHPHNQFLLDENRLVVVQQEEPSPPSTTRARRKTTPTKENS